MLGQRNPKQPTIKAISEYLNISPAWLIGYNVPKSTDGLPSNVRPVTRIRRIPLLGAIACGAPIYADERQGEYIETELLVDIDFALTCKGDSMINARVNDGDIVFIRKQSTVKNGEIACIIIDDEATLKRVYFGEGYVQLVAENPAYPPIVFTASSFERIGILGKAVGFQSMF